MQTHLHALSCPYCGEPIEIVIDDSEPVQEFIEDCQVCCRPIQFFVQISSDDTIEVRARAENDTW